MPNWCLNNLTIKHEDPEMIKRVAKSFKKGAFLQEFIPVPKELLKTEAIIFSEDKKQKEKEKENIAKYGFANWYSFCLAKWGTKWDVGGEYATIEKESANELFLSFDSAWSPPIDAYNALIEMGFEIEATYYEPGCYFIGEYENGEDHCYQIDVAPPHLIEEFNAYPEEEEVS